VEPAAIKPFGRVRIEPKPAEGLIEVIGSANGILARSSARARKTECPGYAPAYPEARGYGPPQLVCDAHRDTPPTSGLNRHAWTEYTPSQEIYEQWLALPLIVLAGLR